MSGINRRGQKVVCVVEVEYESQRTGHCYRGGPRLNEVYTVTDFLGPRPTLRAEQMDVDGVEFIDLLEVRSLYLEIPGQPRIPIGWPVICFRPVDERRTDISDLVALGRNVKQSEPA